MLKLKADISMRKAGSTSKTSQTTAKEDEMVIGANQAYETVEMHYHSASRNQPHSSGNATGEPVYENQQHL